MNEWVHSINVNFPYHNPPHIPLCFCICLKHNICSILTTCSCTGRIHARLHPQTPKVRPIPSLLNDQLITPCHFLLMLNARIQIRYCVYTCVPRWNCWPHITIFEKYTADTFPPFSPSNSAFLHVCGIPLIQNDQNYLWLIVNKWPKPPGLRGSVLAQSFSIH